jgi:hypothetical protein
MVAMLCASSLLPATVHAEQFNLFCSGVVYDSKNSEITPISETLRLDTDINKWCWNVCDRISNIVATDDDTYLLANDIDRDVEISIRVNRRSGKLTNRTFTKASNLTSWIDETCVRRPFTGFPAPKF